MSIATDHLQVSGPRAAQLLGVSESTVRTWRHRGIGPVVCGAHPNGGVAYRLGDLRKWARENGYVLGQLVESEVLGVIR